MTEVYGIIRKLGATSKYKGYYYVQMLWRWHREYMNVRLR